MYKIRFIWVGKIQDSYIRLGVEDYISRIKPYAAVETVVTKAVAPVRGIEHAKTAETRSILKHLAPDDYNVILDEHGDQCTSTQLASWLQETQQTRSTRINFIVGGAYGLDLSQLNDHKKLSLSSMTFTHQMVRLFLLEQVYRAFMIINRRDYHH